MLALTPQQNDAAFIREVDEELRRDQATTLARRYGRWFAIAVVALLIVFGAFMFWQHNRKEQAGVAGESFVKALNAIEEGKEADAQAALVPLTKSDADGYRAAAQLTQAALLLRKNDVKGAAAAYKAVADDAGIAEPFREAALIRQTAAEFDTLPPADVIARLKPYAVPGNAWYGSAGEMTGIALLRLNRTKEAATLFAAISKDVAVPETIRLRVSKVASGYGAEALAEPVADPAATAPTKE